MCQFQLYEVFLNTFSGRKIEKLSVRADERIGFHKKMHSRMPLQTKRARGVPIPVEHFVRSKGGLFKLRAARPASIGAVRSASMGNSSGVA